MEEKQLKIHYDGPIEPKLDKVLRKTLEELGWIWYASGWMWYASGGERDIAFYKPKGEQNAS